MVLSEEVKIRPIFFEMAPAFDQPNRSSHRSIVRKHQYNDLSSGRSTVTDTTTLLIRMYLQMLAQALSGHVVLSFALLTRLLTPQRYT